MADVFFSNGELESKTIRELLEIYNANTRRRKQKTFKNKKVAVRKVMEALRENAEAHKPKDAPSPATVYIQRNRELAETIRSRGLPAPKTIDQELPFYPQYPPKTRQKFPKRAGRRDITLALLRRPEGATIQEVMSACGWDRKTAMDGIRLLHVHMGWGLTHDEEGRIRAYALWDDSTRD